MIQKVNIENDEITIPYYAEHKDGLILGFFGPFCFLSNFYILEYGIFLNEIFYPSVEHAYQAAKWPPNNRNQFLDISSAQAKRLGREAPNFNGKKWNKNKRSIMSEMVRQKFVNNPKLGKMLLMTEDCLLEERNNWGDVYWGTNEKGEGENHLGQILMEVRHALKLMQKGDVF